MTLLTRFDQAWVSYLEQFVAWKFADVASLQVRDPSPSMPFVSPQLILTTPSVSSVISLHWK